MVDAFIWLGASIGALLFLALVYRVEEARERRFFERVRGVLDRGVGVLFTALARVRGYLGAGSLRLGLLYVWNRFLQICLRFVRSSETFVETRLRHNRRRAKKVSASLSTPSHLQELQAFKASTTLSDKEKRRLKAFK